MVWRQPFESRPIAPESVEVPLGIPDDCVVLIGPLAGWNEMMLWERLVAESGREVWFAVQADARMAQAVIPRSRLDRVLLVTESGAEVRAVGVRNGIAVVAFEGKATEAALDQFMEAMK